MARVSGFYKGQFQEATKRKNALLLGDSILGNWGNYTREIAKVYANPDTLFVRVKYLCSLDEITFFVTDYMDLAFQKSDSLYLNKKKKYIYLYRCLE